LEDSGEFSKKQENINKFLAIFRGLNLDMSLEDRLVYIIFNAIFTINVAKEVQKNKPLLKLLFEVDKFIH